MITSKATCLFLLFLFSLYHIDPTSTLHRVHTQSLFQHSFVNSKAIPPHFYCFLLQLPHFLLFWNFLLPPPPPPPPPTHFYCFPSSSSSSSLTRESIHEVIGSTRSWSVSWSSGVNFHCMQMSLVMSAAYFGDDGNDAPF